MALIETLTDNFDDNSLDGAKWTTGGTVVETNQQIELGEGGDLYSATTYDLTASSTTCLVTAVTNTTWFLWLYVDGDNSLYFEVGGGELRARKKVGGGESVIAYDTWNISTMKYLRIREASGTVYWDYSANGSSWTNLASESTPITITAVELNFLAFYGTAAFDDVNILPSATQTGFMTANKGWW